MKPSAIACASIFALAALSAFSDTLAAGLALSQPIRCSVRINAASNTGVSFYQVCTAQAPTAAAAYNEAQNKCRAALNSVQASSPLNSQSWTFSFFRLGCQTNSNIQPMTPR